MRKFYQVVKAGSLNNLRLFSSEAPEPGEGKVLVNVRAIGLNYADIFAIMGLYSATPKGSFIPGLEFSGVVSNSRSPDFKAGQKVIGVTRFGGYDSAIVADPDYLMALPRDWSFEQGAAFPVQTFTAYYALVNLGNLRQGQSVLIHSAAGGVGLQANRIAKKYNAFTIGVVGNDQKLPLLRKEGFDAGIVRGPAFRQELRKALDGRELHLALEATGGVYFRESYKALTPMGRIVAYGSAQFTPRGHRPDYFSLLMKYLLCPRVDPLSMISENKSVMAFNLIWLYERKDLMKELVQSLGALSLQAPMVGHCFPFDNLPDAIKLFKTGSTTGKVVVTV